MLNCAGKWLIVIWSNLYWCFKAETFYYFCVNKGAIKKSKVATTYLQTSYNTNANAIAKATLVLYAMGFVRQTEGRTVVRSRTC